MFIKYNNKYYKEVQHDLTKREEMIELIIDTVQFEMPRIYEMLKLEFQTLFKEREFKKESAPSYLALNNPTNMTYEPITCSIAKIRNTVATDAELKAITTKILSLPQSVEPTPDPEPAMTKEEARALLDEIRKMRDEMERERATERELPPHVKLPPAQGFTPEPPRVVTIPLTSGPDVVVEPVAKIQDVVIPTSGATDLPK